ncbi:DEAD H (Asp-Glu-Ala-Asp His) box helicase 11 [Entomortierella beljakovae]|nr:DEAD H (Asp-Glu-Ala-Asp His) box helicase 11 [Entomortierella beljakovae]
MDAWNLDDDKEANKLSQENQGNYVPLPTPTTFPAFPYPTPYPIQLDFMQQLFQCIDQRKIGVFESPTGTGKSLSMICGAVSWLMEHERAEKEMIESNNRESSDMKESLAKQKCTTTIDGTPDWVQQHHANSDAAFERQEREARRLELETRIKKIRDREKNMRLNMARKMKRQATGAFGSRSITGQSKKKKDQDPNDDDIDMDDSEFLVDDYDSDDNEKGSKRKGGGNDYGNVSKEVMELLKSFDAREADHKPKSANFPMDDENEEPDVLKIYYCSRTHSQLSQFVDELRKTSYGDHLHVISLGSRKSLCINERFKKQASIRSSKTTEPIVSVNKLNEACLDAQKSGTPSDQRCEFLHLPTPSFGNKSRSVIGGRGGGSRGIDEDETGPSNSSEWWRSSVIDSDEKLLDFRDNTLARVRDIEELAELGSELETCPYYGSRQTVRHCQLVTLPYNLLLHASTRESLKLIIKNNILLLDEAHNLINSLLQMHSVALSLQQIQLAKDQLQVYLNRYEKRLSSANEGYIRVLIRILKCLEGFVEKWGTGTPIALQGQQPLGTASSRTSLPTSRVMKVNEFLHDAGMDHINLFKAHAYLDTSGVARKLQGLHESIQKREAKRLAKEEEKASVKIHPNRGNSSKQSSQQPLRQSSTSPILLTVDAFLMSLLNADNDGRVIIAMESEESSSKDDNGDDDSIQTGSASAEPVSTRDLKPVLKFMLLNPANVFKPLVEEARSVVLAGGTMEPVSDLLSHLFPYLKETSSGFDDPSFTRGAATLYPRIHRFSCGHVIPKENLLTIVLEKSPTGNPIELNFANRNLNHVIDGIGQSLANLLSMIPDGVIVFFVSYSYMAQVLARWQVRATTTTGTAATNTIMERIQSRKRVFLEPRETNEADRVLKEYHDCIHARPEHQNPTPGGPIAPRGAVLFSVVGGKMSEGINFSDRLGRGVVMIGMPFPNKSSAELQERMRYMDQVQQQEVQQMQKQGRSPAASVRMTAGNEYYENLCMKAVNQSIGRAIRHQNDYAVIVLMDKRYSNPRIQKKLPGWIGSSVEKCEQFGPAFTLNNLHLVMETSSSALPSAPVGYVYAGPVSDFIPPSNVNTDTDDPNSTSQCTTSTAAAESACVFNKKDKNDNNYLIKVIEVPQPAGKYPPQRRIAVTYFHKKWYAFINICPHQGSALSRGSMLDIEDMGIVWGAGISCSLHDWTFDAFSGQSEATRFVIDTYDVKEIDGHVFLSNEPRNASVAGPRRDFGGREMN